MDALIIVLGIVLGYVAFVTITIGLARLMFPKINIDDDELIGEGIVKLANNVKKIRSKIGSPSHSKKYSLR